MDISPVLLLFNTLEMLELFPDDFLGGRPSMVMYILYLFSSRSVLQMCVLFERFSCKNIV